MVTPVTKREAVALRRQVYEVSQRRADVVIGADRTSIRYRWRKPDDGAVRSRLRELAAARRRFGAVLRDALAVALDVPIRAGFRCRRQPPKNRELSQLVARSGSRR
jgi:hypothetical protein